MAKSRKGIGGRPRTVKTPEALWEKFVEYMEYVDANPHVKEYVETRSNGSVKKNKVTTPLPYSKRGFCVFLGTSTAYLRQLPDEYSTMLKKIEDHIFHQQFSMAAVGEFKENIIGRMLGLVDKKHIEHQGEVQVFEIGGQKIEFK